MGLKHYTCASRPSSRTCADQHSKADNTHFTASSLVWRTTPLLPSQAAPAAAPPSPSPSSPLSLFTYIIYDLLYSCLQAAPAAAPPSPSPSTAGSRLLYNILL